MWTVKQNIKKIYWYYFFRSLIFAYVIERLFWASRGMQVTDTVYTEMVYAVAILILEVPSGLFADRFRRKDVIVVACIFNVVASLIIVNAYGLFQFSLAILFSAFHGALSSGSVNALLYDSLSEIGAEKRFNKELAKIKMIRYGTGLVAAILGAYMADFFGLTLNYWLSSVSGIMGFMVVLTLKEPKRSGSEEETSLDLKKLIRMTLEALLQKGSLRALMIKGAAVAGSIVYFEEFWQNHFTNLGVKTYFLGWISAVMSLSVVIFAYFSPRIIMKLAQIEKIKPYQNDLLLILMGVCYLLGSLNQLVVSLMFMCLASGIAAINENVVFTCIHHQVNGKHRATMESVYSMVERLMVMVIGLLFAFVSDGISLRMGFIAIGTLLMGMTLSTVSLKRLKCYTKLIE